MAVYSIPELITRVQTVWATNGTGQITASVSRDLAVDIVDSLNAIISAGNQDPYNDAWIQPAIEDEGEQTKNELRASVATEGNDLKKLYDLILLLQSGKQDTLAFTPESTANKDVANGYAGLDANGKVPAARTYGSVDEILEYDEFDDFPASGTTAKIYVDKNISGEPPTPRIYRWSGTQYTEIVASPGTTDAVTEGEANKYHTAARVRETTLTGLPETENTPIAEANQLLTALARLQGQINNRVVTDGNKVLSDNNYDTTAKSKVDNLPANTNNELIAINQIIADLQQNPGGQTITDTDDVNEGSTNLYHTVARVLAATLIGYAEAVATASAITADDSILLAAKKLQLQVTANTEAVANKLNRENSDLPFYIEPPLYNWHAVNTGKLAPTGWRVPTQSDWQALATYLGGLSVAGGKLKMTGTNYWLAPNTGATNETGFGAIGNQYRSESGSFLESRTNKRYWAATEHATATAWRYRLAYNSAALAEGNYYKLAGFSVVCVRDTDPGTATVTDIEGNVYNVVQIGTQYWLKEDLRTTLYNDGEPIPVVTDATQWAALTTGAMCYANNKNTYQFLVQTKYKIVETVWRDAIVYNDAEVRSDIATAQTAAEAAQTTANAKADKPGTIAYTTEVPLNKDYTLITGKTLDNNDTFTVATGATEGGAAIITLTGNGTNAPALITNFTKWVDSDDYNVTSGKKNLITFFRLDGVNYYSIKILN